jgi:RimJ/RimL family protein N-acetyltransferase
MTVASCYSDESTSGSSLAEFSSESSGPSEGEVALIHQLSSLHVSAVAAPVLVEIAHPDLKIWKDYLEYRHNRLTWDSDRAEEWKTSQPKHIQSIFLSWPVLETERLRLRPLRESDLQPANRMFSDLDTMRFYGSRTHDSLEYTEKNYLDLMMRRFEVRDSATFVITLKADDEDNFIGQVCATQFDKAFKFAEVSYILDHEYWGSGIMTEALDRVIEFLLRDIRIHKVRAGCFVQNVGSRRVLEKVGFKQEGYLRDNAIVEGRFVDEVIMAIFSHDVVDN